MRPSSRPTGTPSQSHLAWRGLDPETGPRRRRATVRRGHRPHRGHRGGDRRARPEPRARPVRRRELRDRQALPVGRLTAAAHRAGAIVGWQLAQRPATCRSPSTTTMSISPSGARTSTSTAARARSASIFVHERHLGPGADVPRLDGWWGAVPDHRFDPDGPVRRRTSAPPPGRCRRRRSSPWCRWRRRWRSSTRSAAGPARALDPADRLPRRLLARPRGGDHDARPNPPPAARSSPCDSRTRPPSSTS